MIKMAAGDTTVGSTPGNSNHLQVSNTAIWTNGVDGAANTAYLFNGSSSVLSNTSATFLPQGDMPWTVTAWVRSDFPEPEGSGNVSQTFVALGDLGSGCYSVHFGAQKNNYLGVKTNCQGYYQTSGDDIAVWRHAAVVYDGRTLYQYLDGQMVYSTALSGLSSGGASSIYIGNDQSIAPFKGAIDHVRIYRGALDWLTIGTQAQEFSGP